MQKTKTVLVVMLLAALCVPVFADHHETKLPEDGYLGSFARDIEFVSGRLMQLADVIPADKYSWRPTEEVRSASEVFIHVSMANFFLSQMLGVPMPEDVQALGREAEAKITKKEDVIKFYERSIEQVKTAIAENVGADLEEKTNFFGQDRAKRDVFLQVSAHSHEHLGQSISYVRMLGLVPPWSQSQDDDG